MYLDYYYVPYLEFCDGPYVIVQSPLNKNEQNHSTQDSRVVPHRGTNWAALWLTAQIERDAVLSESYGHGCYFIRASAYKSFLIVCSANDGRSSVRACIQFKSPRPSSIIIGSCRDVTSPAITSPGL